MKQYRGFYFRIFLLFFGLLVAFGVSLVVDRLWGIFWFSRPKVTLMIPRVTEKYSMLESDWVATISAQGLRNDLVQTPKPPGIYRILVLGDSFAYGWGVNVQDTWENKLQQKLQGAGRSVEVVNAGAPGISYREEWKACQAYARRFDVDAVVATSFVFDDLYQVAQLENDSSLWVTIGRFFWPNISSGFEPTLVTSWHRASPGSTVFSEEKWSSFTRAQMIIHSEWYTGLDPLVLEGLRSGKLNPSFFGPFSGDREYLVRLLDTRHQAYAVGAARTWLSRIKSCAGKRPFIVVVIPSATLVARDFFPHREALKFSVSDALLTVDVDAFMKPLVESVGARYIGLTEVFRQGHCVDCYFRWDPHLTPLGNKMIAETLTPVIESVLRAKP